MSISEEHRIVSTLSRYFQFTWAERRYTVIPRHRPNLKKATKNPDGNSLHIIETPWLT